MYGEYEPRFYTILDAEENCYYYTGGGNYDGCERISDGVFRLRSKDVRIDVSYGGSDGCGAVRQRTTITNTGDEPVSVDRQGRLFTVGKKQISHLLRAQLLDGRGAVAVQYRGGGGTLQNVQSRLSVVLPHRKSGKLEHVSARARCHNSRYGAR